MRLHAMESSSCRAATLAAASWRSTSKAASVSFFRATNSSAISLPHLSMCAFSSVNSCSTCCVSAINSSAKTAFKSASNFWTWPSSCACDDLTFASNSARSSSKRGRSSCRKPSVRPWACAAASWATRLVASCEVCVCTFSACETLPNSANSSVRTSFAAFSPACLAAAASCCSCALACSRSSAVAAGGFFGAIPPTGRTRAVAHPNKGAEGGGCVRRRPPKGGRA
mmetsp:Transcript_115389/g.331169  ORF Transcript_115389/g.331169 Transcript_115389/m.331169 type:complete len:226 (+) Transcript_115389:1841-2518(+)